MAETKADRAGAALEKVGTQLQKLTLTAIRDGVGPITGSEAYAQSRLQSTGRRDAVDGVEFAVPAELDPEAAIKRIVKESVAASATQGFVTGIGGFIAMPVTLPANMAGSLIINARMVGAIAHLRGYDLEDPHTQAVMMMTIAGSSAQGAVSALGVKVGSKLTEQAIKAVPMAVIREINKKAGFYLVAKYGSKRSAVTLAKGIPFAGAVVGSSVDGTLTRGVGATAKKMFPPL